MNKGRKIGNKVSRFSLSGELVPDVIIHALIEKKNEKLPQ